MLLRGDDAGRRDVELFEHDLERLDAPLEVDGQEGWIDAASPERRRHRPVREVAQDGDGLAGVTGEGRRRLRRRADAGAVGIAVEARQPAADVLVPLAEGLGDSIALLAWGRGLRLRGRASGQVSE